MKLRRVLTLVALLTAGNHVLAGDGDTPPDQVQVRRLTHVRVPMRDGVRLATDVWLPQAKGRYPIVLMRTPYGRTGDPAKGGYREQAQFWTSKGYAWVVQDVRGSGGSEGSSDFGYHIQEEADGYDTIEWLARQPWSNGKVGMTGGSYLGIAQWLAMRAAPPHLTCTFPQAAPGSHFDDYVPYVGGAWAMSFVMGWAAERVRSTVAGRLPGAAGGGETPASRRARVEEAYRHRPLLTMDEAAFGYEVPLSRVWLQHSTLDDYWKREWFTEDHYRKMNIPAVTVTGWFDCAGCLTGSIEYFTGMRQHSPARHKQHILIGPWNHGETRSGGTPRIGELDRQGSVMDIQALNVAWFDHCLKGASSSFEFPVARVFITGLNVWKDFDEYPPAQVHERRLYLHSGGKANTLDGDGRLSWDVPRGDQRPDRYRFDPRNPVRAPEGHGVDQREVERRDDVLVYTTGVLAQPVEVLGKVTVVLHAATDALDTDWTAKIVDVYPDGRALNLGSYPSGILRARYRQGFDREVLVTRNRPDEYRIHLGTLGHAFMPGHRIRIEISSSDYPGFAPNQNTGNPVATDTEWQAANQTIFHDRLRPSHVLLPTMPASDATRPAPSAK